MVSDGDYDGYHGLTSNTPARHVYSADKATEEALLRSDPFKAPYSPVTGKGYFGYVGASRSRPVAVLGARKRLYRRLGQMFLRWAETAND